MPLLFQLCQKNFQQTDEWTCWRTMPKRYPPTNLICGDKKTTADRVILNHSNFLNEKIHCKFYSLHYNITGVILKGRGRSYPPKLSHFSLYQAQREVVLHRIYRKNIPKDYHFSSKLQKTVKTSPCFKFVGLPLYQQENAEKHKVFGQI